MYASEKMRKIARDLVLVYVHHIKHSINIKDEDYVKLGIDEDFESYEALFKVVISRVLGVDIKVDMIHPNIVITECLNVLNDEIERKNYTMYVDSKIKAECIYEVCLYILKKVKEEEFNESVVYYN